MNRLRVPLTIGVILIAAGGLVFWRLGSSVPPKEKAGGAVPSISLADDITRYAHFSSPGMNQMQVGASVYDNWCAACHAETGLGLTADWRAQWDPEHQNCWQAKCHSLDHPSDGFVIPRSVPPVVGALALGSFKSAADLHGYMQTTMPFAEKGVLDDDIYWALTAYLLNRNAIPSGAARIGPHNAGLILLAR